MSKEILGYSIMVKVENYGNEIELSDYTKFGRICSENTLRYGISSVLTGIVSLFNEFAKTRNAACIGLPFYSKDENVVNRVTEKFESDLLSKIDKRYTSSAIEQIQSGKEKIFNEYELEVEEGIELNVKFKYIVQIVPFYEKDIGTNWIPTSK